MTSRSDRLERTMRQVQSTDAEAHLARLLSAVERGESFAITRHGKPIAHLVPPAATDPASRAAALERFRKRRAAWPKARFSIDEILAARHEGHRS